MSDKSPLFVSSMELLAHATELYARGDGSKYKFSILHLANAIELILKDRLIDKGVSIYIPKKPVTIGIWDAFEKLEKVKVIIPERPVIEILIDDRNTIQHRFGFPNAETVFFYIEQVLAFFKRFLDEEYAVDLADVLKLHLSEENLALIGLSEIKEDEYAALDKLYKISPESAITQAFNLVEGKFLQIIKQPETSRKRPFIIWQHPDFPHVLDNLAINKFLNQETVRNFHLLRNMRNRAAHAAHFENEHSNDEWEKALSIAKDLLKGLDKAIDSGFFDEKGTDKNASSSGSNDDKGDS
jgi:hypothetical protein